MPGAGPAALCPGTFSIVIRAPWEDELSSWSFRCAQALDAHVSFILRASPAEWPIL